MDQTTRLEKRIRNRRMRRWRRRLRIAVPFMTLPLLVAALVLSVGIIEYNPKEPPERLTDRPISKTNLEERKRMASRRLGISKAAVLTSPSPHSERLMNSLRPLQPNKRESETIDRIDPLGTDIMPAESLAVTR